MTLADCVADVLYRLGFIDATDLAATESWLTEDELYLAADEAIQQAAYESGLFVGLDTSITVSSGTATYNLPASHVFTLAAWLGANWLRMTPVRELFALDATWNTTTGAATRATLDVDQLGTITLYPIPTAGGTLKQLAERYPATVDAGSPAIALPTVLQDWLSYEMLAASRDKESDARMPEMAEHFEQRAGLYRKIIEHLYGRGH